MMGPIEILILVLGGVLLVKALRQSRSTSRMTRHFARFTSLPGTRSRRRRHWLVAAVGVVMAIGGIRLLRDRGFPNAHDVNVAWSRLASGTDSPADQNESAGIRLAEQLPVDAFDSTLPDWVRQSADHDQQRVVTSRLMTTQEDAEQSAMAGAATVLKQEFERRERSGDEWNLPTAWVRNSALVSTHHQQVEHDFGSFTADMHRVFLLVDTSPETMDAVRPLWREQVSDARVRSLSGLIGIPVLIVFALAGFLRSTPVEGQRRSTWAGLLAAAIAVIGVSAITFATSPARVLTVPIAVERSLPELVLPAVPVDVPADNHDS